MNCNQAQKLIDAYVDNELDAQQRAIIDAHLSSCPACAEQMRQVDRITALSQQFEMNPTEGLKGKIALEVLAQRPTTMDRIKEKLKMKNRVGIRVGMATMVVAAVVGTGFVLAPKPAAASGAIKVYNRMIKAAKNIGACHTVSEGKMGDGTPWRVEIWTDGRDLWVDRMGHLEIIYKGKFHYGGKDIDYKKLGIGEDQMIAVGPVDPALFTLSSLLQSLGRDHSQPVDLGFTTLRGKRVQMIGIRDSTSGARHTFFVPQGSDLPMRSIVEGLEAGGWVQSEVADYEFVDRIPPALFKNLPPAVKMHDPAPEDIEKMAKTLGSRKK